MKLLILIAALTFSATTYAGSDQGGGGNGVMTKDGKILLLDLADPTGTYIDASAANDRVYTKTYKGFALMKTGGGYPLSFFDNSILLFKKQIQEFPILEELNVLLTFTKVLATPMNFTGILDSVVQTTDEFEVTENFKQGYYSESINVSKQIPIAAYIGGALMISETLLNKLDKASRLGVEIHESLRVLNMHYKTGLSTSEIEVMTRYFLGRSRATDSSQIQAAKNKIKSAKPAFANLSAEEKIAVQRTVTCSAQLLKEIQKNFKAAYEKAEGCKGNPDHPVNKIKYYLFANDESEILAAEETTLRSIIDSTLRMQLSMAMMEQDARLSKKSAAVRFFVQPKAVLALTRFKYKQRTHEVCYKSTCKKLEGDVYSMHEAMYELMELSDKDVYGE